MIVSFLTLGKNFLIMILYPLENYIYASDLIPEINLEKLFIFHKYQLLKAFVIIKPITIDEHNNLIDATNDIIEKFKENISSFSDLPNQETKWEWVGRIKSEQNIILEKSYYIINKQNNNEASTEKKITQ